MGRLTDKQEAFIRAYIGPARFNGTNAAEMAGYSGDRSTLATIASENLTKPKIRKAVDEKLNALLPSNSVLLSELARIALDHEATDRDRRMAIRDLLELRGEFITRVNITSDKEAHEKMDELFGLIRTDDHEGGDGA